MLYAVRVDTRSLEIRTDSQYVLDHWAVLHLENSLGPRWSHYDLWLALHGIIASRSNDFRLRKVKGHATSLMVAEGLVLPVDKEGNDGADDAATQGLLLLHSPALAWKRHQARAVQARTIQAVMVEVILARGELPKEREEARALDSRARAVRPTPSLSPPVLSDPWDPRTGP